MRQLIAVAVVVMLGLGLAGLASARTCTTTCYGNTCTTTCF